MVDYSLEVGLRLVRSKQLSQAKGSLDSVLLTAVV